MIKLTALWLNREAHDAHMLFQGAEKTIRGKKLKKWNILYHR